MSDRVLKQHDKERHNSEVVENETPDQQVGDQVKSDLDSILDQIDEVLEENAEEFVKSYVQKGGQ